MGRQIPLPPEDSHLTLTLAAIADNWGRKSKSSALFINRIAMNEDWETFYLLLYDFLHQEKDSLFPYEKLLRQLNTAPITGPYCYNEENPSFRWLGEYKSFLFV